ncbi:hypothetical protein D3C78_1906000 [compost metagenome]
MGATLRLLMLSNIVKRCRFHVLLQVYHNVCVSHLDIETLQRRATRTFHQYAVCTCRPLQGGVRQIEPVAKVA